MLALAQIDSVAILPKMHPLLRTVAGEDIMFSTGMWCTILCPVVFTSILLTWQQLRTYLGFRSRLVFLDKVCIGQADEQLKARGILSIPAFLRESRRLVICWTPTYFTRLWCVFELSSWKHLRKPVEDVLLMPSAHAVLVFVMMASLCCFYVMQMLLGTLVSWMAVGLQLALVVANVEATRGLVDTVMLLSQQLQSFRVRESKCYCCSVNHIMPNTGKPIPCVRLMIYKTINQWFGASDHAESVSDEQFCTALSDFASSQAYNSATMAVVAKALHLSIFFNDHICWNGSDNVFDQREECKHFTDIGF